MMAAPDERLKALRRLLFLAAVMGLGYLCTRTLRFTNDFLNIAFVCSFFANSISSCWGSSAAGRLAQNCNNDTSCPVTGALNGVSPPHSQLLSSRCHGAC